MKYLLRVSLLAVAIALLAPASQAQTHSFFAVLDGPSEAPPNASPGTGFATVIFDLTAHTMTVQASFSGLIGNVTIAHIHAPTAIPFTGTAGVATPTPTFPGFPAGVTAGGYNNTLDMTQAASYNAPFLAANGGSPAAAELALFNAANQGRAYFNIHTSSFPGGEIRGFLQAVAPEPGSIGLLGLGLGLGVVALRRRKK